MCEHESECEHDHLCKCHEYYFNGERMSREAAERSLAEVIRKEDEVHERYLMQ
jgi:hypothetical protein